VWPEHQEIVEAFFASSTQWRVVAQSTMESSRLVYLSLDYAAAKVAIDASGIAITADLMRGLRIMERAARQALNER
jgi:hypothetical protein